jgi:hypothetical protein
VDCTTAMNGGPPERAGVYTSVSPFEIYVRTVLTCTCVSLRCSFTRLEHARELLRFTVRPGDAIWHGLHRIFVRDSHCVSRSAGPRVSISPGVKCRSVGVRRIERVPKPRIERKTIEYNHLFLSGAALRAIFLPER